MTAIQNAGLGEFRSRDLNDQINKLLREKKHWENRIRELGGRSYSSRGPKMLDRSGFANCIACVMHAIYLKKISYPEKGKKFPETEAISISELQGTFLE